MNKTTSSQRVWELDALRGVAMLMMAMFHLVFDLSFYYGKALDYTRGFWYYEGLSSALLFILVSGVSVTLGRNPMRRGFTVLAWGMLLTLATYLADPSLYIRFGILHFLGVSMVLAAAVRRWPPRGLLAMALASVVLGVKLRTMSTSAEYLFPVGLISANFQSLDYYPLFPYLSVTLVGILIGQLLYRQRRSLFAHRWGAASGLQWLGRHSLVFYLVHQPALLALLYAVHALGLV